MKKFALLGLGFVIVVVLGMSGWYFLIRDTSEPVADQSTEQPLQPENDVNGDTDDPLTGTMPAMFTKESVAEHATKDDCWTIISGKVYDITEYIPRHPGGDEILLACGTDGTSLFTQRETSDGKQIGSGSPHSSRANSQLEQFLKGDLGTTTNANSGDMSAQ